MAEQINIRIGQGTKVFARLLEDGILTEPEEGITGETRTISAAAATGDEALTLGSAISGFVLPKGSFYEAKNPTTGAIVPFQLAEKASSGTGLVTEPLILPIASGSTFNSILRLTGRQKAGIDRKANIVNVTTFDTDGDQLGRAVGRSYSINFEGIYSQLDAAYNTIEYAYKNALYIWFYIQLTPPDTRFSIGKIYKGVGIIEGLPIDIPADGLLQGNITLQGSGALQEVLPVAA